MADPALARFLGEFERYPGQAWNECGRGDFLLVAAERWGAPKQALIDAATDIAHEAGVFAERLEAELDEVRPRVRSGKTWGRYTEHWMGHIQHAIADCMHSIAHRNHLTGHDGVGHAAFCADHFIAALWLAYVDPDANDPDKDRVKGTQEGYQKTEKIVRECIAFEMLNV